MRCCCPPGKLVGAIERALQQTHPFERLQGDPLICPRQRKHRAQGGMCTNAADQNVL